MKLELKHLAPYLNSSLKFQHPVLIWGGNPPEPSHDEIGESEMTIKNIHDVIRGGMPILIPLSHLHKEIEINGEKFIPIERINELHQKMLPLDDIEEITYDHELDQLYFDCSDGIDYWFTDILTWHYWMVEKLFEWHFDVFGLINEGLAIAIKN